MAWQLEYDGGWPVTTMNITVEALDSSSAPVRTAGRPAPVTYSIGVNSSYLVTSSYPQGWVYLVTAQVQNKVGTSTFKAKGNNVSELHWENPFRKQVYDIWYMMMRILRLLLHAYWPLPTAFVGSVYTVICSFETQSCPWALLGGQKITSGNGGPLQPAADGDGHANGRVLMQWNICT